VRQFWADRRDGLQSRSRCAAGQNNPYTVDEYVDLDNFLDGCRYALALAQTVSDAS